MKIKLDADQRQEAELVIEEMQEDPDKFAFELVYLRHENIRLQNELTKVQNKE